MRTRNYNAARGVSLKMSLEKKAPDMRLARYLGVLKKVYGFTGRCENIEDLSRKVLPNRYWADQIAIETHTNRTEY